MAVYEKFLLKFANFLTRTTTSYIMLNKQEKAVFAQEIIKGSTFVPSIIDRKIKKFLDSIDLEDLVVEDVKAEELVEINQLDSAALSGNMSN